MIHNGASGPEIVLPRRISAGLWSQGNPPNRPSGRPSGGRGADFEVSRLESSRNPSRKTDLRPGSTIANISICRSIPRPGTVTVCAGFRAPEARIPPQLVTLCYAIVLPGWKSCFRAGFRPDSNRENMKIVPAAGLRPGGGPILRVSRLESGRNPAQELHVVPGSTIA